MGNRAVITTFGATDNEIGVYLHWDGDLEHVEAFLTYCKMKGFRSPETDCYGFSYLCTILGNFFGNGRSVGVDTLNHLDRDNYDNGVYYIKDWKIVARSYKDEPIATDKTRFFNYLKMINDYQSENIKVSENEIKLYCAENNIPTYES